MKKLLVLLAFGIFNALCGLADPELVFDKDNPDVAIGIKLNLPESIQVQILSKYLKVATVEEYEGSQEEFESDLNRAQEFEDFKRLAMLILTNDLYIPASVLLNKFEERLLGFYNCGDVSFGFGSNTVYFTRLHNMISLCF